MYIASVNIYNNMKYLITESQAKMAATFLKLDMKNFIQIKKGNRIYFLNSEGDEYAKIRYDKSDGWCGVNYDLVNEISSFFSLQRSDSQEVIGRWVENTLQMKVTNTLLSKYLERFLLRIPSK